MLQYRQKTYNIQKGLVPMTRDMTTGSIPRHMLAYAVPLLFGNLFQQLYNTVDSLVVGRMDGKQALAAVGAAGPVMNILIFLVVGISMGASILMALFYICTGVCNSFQGLFRGLGKLQVTLYATLVQIPVRVAITWLLVPSLGVTGAAAGVACGWLCMIAYELYAYRKHWKTTHQ